MAHPGCYSTAFAKTGALVDPAVDAAVDVCARAGVRGLEVFYPYDRSRPYSDGTPPVGGDGLSVMIEHYASLAAQYGLLMTGGTDFHGTNKPEIEIGDVDVPYGLLQGLRESR